MEDGAWEGIYTKPTGGLQRLIWSSWRRTLMDFLRGDLPAGGKIGCSGLHRCRYLSCQGKEGCEEAEDMKTEDDSDDSEAEDPIPQITRLVFIITKL